MRVYNGNNLRRFLFEDGEEKDTLPPITPNAPTDAKPASTKAGAEATPSTEEVAGANSASAKEKTKAAEPLKVEGVEIPNDDPNEALVIKYIIETALKAGKDTFDSEVASIASKLNKKPEELEQDYKNAIIWKLIENKNIAALLGKEEDFKKYIQASKKETENATASEGGTEQVSEDNEDWIKNEDKWIEDKLNYLHRKGLYQNDTRNRLPRLR